MGKVLRAMATIWSHGNWLSDWDCYCGSDTTKIVPLVKMGKAGTGRGGESHKEICDPPPQNEA